MSGPHSCGPFFSRYLTRGFILVRVPVPKGGIASCVNAMRRALLAEGVSRDSCPRTTFAGGARARCARRVQPIFKGARATCVPLAYFSRQYHREHVKSCSYVVRSLVPSLL